MKIDCECRCVVKINFMRSLSCDRIFIVSLSPRTKETKRSELEVFAIKWYLPHLRLCNETLFIRWMITLKTENVKLDFFHLFFFFHWFFFVFPTTHRCDVEISKNNFLSNADKILLPKGHDEDSFFFSFLQTYILYLTKVIETYIL